MNIAARPLRQSWPRPSRPRPIVIIGAGDIVRDAHLPAYAKAGFAVAGVYDLDRSAAAARARAFQIPRVFATMAEAVAVPDAVFDVATPPQAHEGVLAKLPDGAAVLMQKPMGDTFDAARRIAALCQRKQLSAAVNFQLRFSHHMLAIRELVKGGELGAIVDVDVRLNLQTPWERFPFLREQERVEILIHTVHYLDLIRLFLGNPSRAFARTVRHPAFPHLASTRSSIILDYGDLVRCCLSINHCHRFGAEHAAAEIRIEGMTGCAVATLGTLLDYPRGQPDHLAVFARSAGKWADVPLTGGWFPDGFIGTMSNLQRFVAGEDAALISPVSDALETMRLVEACYVANARGGIAIDSIS